MTAAYLLENVSWTGISSDFKISLTASRTQQLCDAMTVSKDLMANLFLVEAVSVQVVEVPQVSLPTRMEQRRIQAGELDRAYGGQKCSISFGLQRHCNANVDEEGKLGWQITTSGR